ncbi:MAG TPA: STAS domain-containing protein [Spirochaetota bacterium]|nr:STAS domain-containing protein [Spirochaetota bacterium]HOK91738.1 STAS domain-containing protein [Spirochaetota bacterium]HPP94861.1 STAS domain-containing protein [Spirochaetota bacterium]
MSGSELNINYTIKNDYIIVYPEERLDLSSSAYLEKSLRSLCQEYPDKNIIINLSRVPFINSAAIGVILLFSRQLASTNLSLKVTNLNDNVKKVISILEAEDLIDIYEDEEKAME